MLILYQYHILKIIVNFTLLFNSWLGKFPFIIHNFKVFWYPEKIFFQKNCRMYSQQNETLTVEGKIVPPYKEQFQGFFVYVAPKKILYFYFIHKFMSDLTSTFPLRLNGVVRRALEWVRNPQLETVLNSFQVSNLRQAAYSLRVLVSLCVKCEYKFYSIYYPGQLWRVS